MNRSDLRFFQGRTQLDRGRPQGLVTFGLIAWAMAASIVVFLDIQSSYRPLVTLSFLLLAPGLSLVRLLRLEDRLLESTLAIALSLALDAIVATLFIYVGAWSLGSIFFVLAYLTFVCALVDLIQSHNRLLNTPAPTMWLWGLRVGLGLAFAVGAVLLVLFFINRSPQMFEPSPAAAQSAEVEGAPVDPTVSNGTNPPGDTSLSEFERLRRLLAAIVSGGEEPSAQAELPNPFVPPENSVPLQSNPSAPAAAPLLLTNTHEPPTSTPLFASSTSEPPTVTPLPLSSTPESPTSTPVPETETPPPTTETPEQGRGKPIPESVKAEPTPERVPTQIRVPFDSAALLSFLLEVWTRMQERAGARQ